MVVHLSTRRAHAVYSWEVELRRGAAGLPATSLAKCNEVYTLFEEQLGDLIGKASDADMTRVDGALRIALGLSNGAGQGRPGGDRP